MSAEKLRRAATLMRERAEAASPSPWEHETASGGTHSIVADDGTFVCDLEDGYYENGGIGGYDVPATADADHIASWHPAVALAVADWLEQVAHRYDQFMDGFQAEALAVARAYLGEQP